MVNGTFDIKANVVIQVICLLITICLKSWLCSC